jgi:hypothetical protein
MVWLGPGTFLYVLPDKWKRANPRHTTDPSFALRGVFPPPRVGGIAWFIVHSTFEVELLGVAPRLKCFGDHGNL